MGHLLQKEVKQAEQPAVKGDPNDPPSSRERVTPSPIRELHKDPSAAQITEDLNEADGGHRFISMLGPAINSGFELSALNNPKIMIGAPSEHYLNVEGYILNPSQQSVYQHQHHHLRGSPRRGGQASREEVELTKRYMGMHDQIRKQKYFSSSVIQGRRLTVDHSR